MPAVIYANSNSILAPLLHITAVLVDVYR